VTGMEQEVTIDGHRLRFRTWTHGEKKRAFSKAVKIDPETGKPEIDPWILNDEMLVASLVEWDLKDKDGHMLPITVKTLESLDEAEYGDLLNKMIRFAQELNRVSEAERKKS